MSEQHIVVGAGPVGREVAQLLSDRGSQVVVVTRTGKPSELPGVRAVGADASDADRLSELTKGAAVLYNCAKPGNYTTWNEVWPPLASSLLTAAERTGATLAITGNLYPYGPVEGEMTEDLPDAATDSKGMLRAKMWADALAGHRAGKIHAFEVRGSDYLGTGVGQNGHISRVVPAALRGKTVRVLGRADQPHSWTDVRDMARTLVAVADRPDAWGRLWHAPTNASRSQEQAINGVMAAVGRPSVKVRSFPAIIKLANPFVPMMRELDALSYQRDSPCLLDSTAVETEFNLEPTPWDEVCRRTGLAY